jgi:hypothetical protein
MPIYVDVHGVPVASGRTDDEGIAIFTVRVPGPFREMSNHQWDINARHAPVAQSTEIFATATYKIDS